MAKTQRIRDSVHGLIVFDGQGDQASLDQIAWKLLNTPEMQRLRRIRQLGVSEFTFPGATHTRFAHSVGVFATARKLIGVLGANLESADRRPDRAIIAVLAALLHDVGHGPFSHAFEVAQIARGEEKDHEDWSAEIINNPNGKIRPILEAYRVGLADEIAKLLISDVPVDAYHAVVSSSFDADRLDYLRRDRLMTGSGAGAIDFDWLVDNLRVAEVSISVDDDEIDDNKRKTFCLDRKAFQAAESFLLARYHLFEQVYLHKTTRSFENVVSQIIISISRAASNGRETELGLDAHDPLVAFFRQDDGDKLSQYLVLDDSTVWSAASRMAANAADQATRNVANRLINRKPFRCLDVHVMFPRRPGESLEEAEGRWQQVTGRIDSALSDRLEVDAFKDVAPISIYSEIGGDSTKAQKRLMILVGGAPHEITQLSDTISALQPKRKLIRYYFASEEAKRIALGAVQ